MKNEKYIIINYYNSSELSGIKHNTEEEALKEKNVYLDYRINILKDKIVNMLWIVKEVKTWY